MLTHWLLEVGLLSWNAHFSDAVFLSLQGTYTENTSGCYSSEGSELLLIEVMVWCHQRTNYYMKQYWTNHGMPYGITRLELVKTLYIRSESARIIYILPETKWMGETCFWHRYTWTITQPGSQQSNTLPQVQGSFLHSQKMIWDKIL